MRLSQRCEKAEILNAEGDVLTKAMVDVAGEDEVSLVVPWSFDRLKQDVFTVVFYDPVQGVLTTRCTFGTPRLLPEQRSTMPCSILEEVSSMQRRLDVKVPLARTLEVIVTGSGVSGTYTAQLVNISAGGVYLTTDVPVPEGTCFCFDFKESNVDLNLTAEVLRSESRADRRGRLVFGYGCKFVHLSSRSEAQLRSFVFQQERMRYKK